VSLGGSIVLFNLVLNFIPTFIYVLFEIIFQGSKVDCSNPKGVPLGWGGSEIIISWVKWMKVCKPRSKRSLGVNNVFLCNLSLLAKWKWRLIKDDHALWKIVLVDKYSVGNGGKFGSQK